MAELLEKLRASVGDRYDVERELGQGGMATVFLARDLRHERKVAIKVLHEDLGAALGAERFRREIQIATSLTHPHVLALYDSGAAADSLFYVMPFVEGESLRHRLDRENQLPIDQALKIATEVASALGYAHRKGVIHRDIKPENILLEDGHAIVADFGIARAVSAMGEAGGALTKTGMSLGTPTYMSPEQSFGEKELDGRSDQYSLACVLYEMLVGQPPFTGANAQAIMARHSMSEVPSMQIVRSTIPDELEDAVQKALAKSPADRFPSVAEFAKELQECVIDYHTTTRRAVGSTRTGMRAAGERRGVPRDALAPVPIWRRKPMVGAVAAVAMIALGTAGWLAWGRSAGAAGSTGSSVDADHVAIEYFRDNSADGSLVYLADGLTENLISRLSEVKTLNVTSRDGVAPYRGKDVGYDSLKTALNVGTLVRGTVESQGDKVNIVVRLIDANTGDPIDAQEFEHPKATIVAAQDSLAERVANMLRERIGSKISLTAQRARTTNGLAWTLVQRASKLRKDGEQQLNRSDAAAAARIFTAADSLLSHASRLDATWTEPLTSRASLALARAQAAESPMAAKPWIELGSGYAERALAREPRNADALETRGKLRYLRWSYSLANDARERNALLDGADADLSAATRIEPTRASAWNALSQVYSQKDDNSKAKIAAQRAYEEDAYLSGTDQVLWRLYATSYDLEHVKDAVTYCSDGARRFPENWLFVRCQLWLQTVKSVPPDPEKAWKDYARLQALAQPQSWKLLKSEAGMLVAASLGRAGLKDSARKVLGRARPDPSDDKEGEYAGVEAFIHLLFAEPADTAEAFRILSRYVSGSPQHRAGLAESQSWWWRGLKQDRRFEDLVSGAQ